MTAKCPKCNTDNEDLEYCLNCGFKLNQHSNNLIQTSASPTNCYSCSYPINILHENCPQCGSSLKNNSGTSPETKILDDGKIRSHTGSAKLVSVSLGKVEANDININQDRVQVNRSLVDENDKSISSECHAQITKENGKWYLENFASNKALFAQVTSKIELKKDMIILIGDSKFYMFQCD